MMRSLVLLSSLATLVLCRPALAQAPARAEDVAAARALGVQGVRLADQGKCSEAIENLERAEALYHAPTILGRLGECQVEVGRIVLGTENLNRVVREQLPPNAPAAFQAAQQRAKGVLDRALPRIAYLVVKVTPKDLPATVVTVDGAPVPNALIGAERPTDPGNHEVIVKATGYNETKASVTLAEGSHQEVALVLTADPNAVAAAAAPSTPTAPPPPAALPPTAPAPTPVAGSGSNHTLAYVMLGVGGAGLITGSVTGLMAMSKKSSLDCPNSKCPTPEHDTLDSAKTLATISTIGFGVGIAGAAVGVVLLVTGGKSEAAPTAQVGRVTARPWAGAQMLGVEGSF
ncbi:MAG TPA: hypothetical protein VG937_31830 [Polyangiaceae bacterium]|nr:hypothetical protein [Polyangiaceae bacterium]